MKLTRITGAVVTLGMAMGLGAVTAAPANAAITRPNVTISSYAVAGTYGDYNRVSAQIGGAGTTTATLYRSVAGGAMSPIASRTTSTYASFSGAEATFQGNAVYRICTSGSTSGSTTYTAACSGDLGVTTFWDLNEKPVEKGPRSSRRLYLKGKLAPAAKGKKVIIQIKRGKWKKYKVDRASATGKYKVRVYPKNGRKGTKYRVLVKGNAQFAETVSRTYKAYRR